MINPENIVQKFERIEYINAIDIINLYLNITLQ